MDEGFEDDYFQKDQAPYINDKRVDISKTFSGSLQNKIAILQQAIDEIDQLIQLRRVLSGIIKERVDVEIGNSSYELSQLKSYQLGNSQSADQRRLWIEREILGLTKEKRSEDVKSWEHISTLIRLRRGFVMELENLLSTKRMLEGSSP